MYRCSQSSIPGGIGAVGGVDLVEDVTDVGGDGSGADEKLFG